MNYIGSALFTVGHSNRSITAFITLLQTSNISLLADVRSVPHSRYNPQFNRSALMGSLAEHSISYRHLPKLGGLRENYIDYMLTPEFRTGIAELVSLQRDHTCAIMCAEARWQNCHRRHITAHLLEMGLHVHHVVALGEIEKAVLAPQTLEFRF